jgi:starvation-inducible DNA-binding protein
MKRFTNFDLNEKLNTLNQPDMRLDHDLRFAVVKILNQILVDEAALSVKTFNAQWIGHNTNFLGMHVFYDIQYQQLDSISDEIVKRTISLGGRAEDIDEGTSIQTRLSDPPIGGSQLQNLIADHEAMIQFLQMDGSLCSEECNDKVTRNILLDILCSHEKMAKMLSIKESAEPLLDEKILIYQE